jgi:hypothetical protein
MLYSDGSAIYIDGSLTCGKTEKCSTFDNPPLCADGDFQAQIQKNFFSASLLKN